MNFLQRLFTKKPVWIYGTCRGREARKHRKKGNVQFVLWPAGKQGHVVDYWHNFHSDWWHLFIASENQPT